MKNERIARDLAPFLGPFLLVEFSTLFLYFLVGNDITLNKDGSVHYNISAFYWNGAYLILIDILALSFFILQYRKSKKRSIASPLVILFFFGINIGTFVLVPSLGDHWIIEKSNSNTIRIIRGDETKEINISEVIGVEPRITLHKTNGVKNFVKEYYLFEVSFHSTKNGIRNSETLTGRINTTYAFVPKLFSVDRDRIEYIGLVLKRLVSGFAGEPVVENQDRAL